MIKVIFDLDGTLFDLYGKKNWLELLETESRGAFIGNFLPEINITELLKVTEKLRQCSVEFEVITWLPKDASSEYQEVCKKEKIEWCRQNLPFVSEVICQPYGIPKQKAIKKRTKQMILIDDNKKVCELWNTKKQRSSININKQYTAIDALYAILEQIENKAC